MAGSAEGELEYCARHDGLDHTLCFVKSSDEVLSTMQVGMGGNWESGGSCFGSGTKQNWVDLAEYGFERWGMASSGIR